MKDIEETCKNNGGNSAVTEGQLKLWSFKSWAFHVTFLAAGLDSRHDLVPWQSVVEPIRCFHWRWDFHGPSTTMC